MRVYAITLTLGLTIASSVCADNAASYEQQILQWRVERMEKLKAPTGYLTLVGLFQMTEGKHTFGFAETDAMRLTHASASNNETIGSFTVQGDAIAFTASPGLFVTHEGERITSIEMHSDRSGAIAILELGSLRWYIVQRGEQLLLRVRDLEATVPKTFPDFDYFPVDPGWKLEATFNVFNEPTVFTVPNVLGEIVDMKSTGNLSFTIAGETYVLDVADEGDELFVIFGDATSGKETYGAGRFVYVDKPKAGEKTIIDFNKSYNPPCAFSDYTTCPLPPKGNILPMSIRAGEKSFKGRY